MSKVLLFKERMREYCLENPYTDDIPELFRYESHFVFVYGTLKAGLPRHDLLRNDPDVKFQGIGRTDINTFELVNTHFYFPVALEKTGAKREGAIKGELYLVPTKLLLLLDEIECNGKMFDRKFLSVRCIREGKTPETLQAWCYLGNNNFWRTRTGSFSDLPLREDKGGKFYYYTHEDNNGSVVNLGVTHH